MPDQRWVPAPPCRPLSQPAWRSWSGYCSGCFELSPDVYNDNRGLFVKTFQKNIFRDFGLEFDFEEEYYSCSKKGVLRGLHFQLPPHEHSKLVYCIEGNVFDAVVDLRINSMTYGEYVTVELSAKKANMLYVPPGLAHGFYVLSKRATMVYKVSTVYSPK